MKKKSSISKRIFTSAVAALVAGATGVAQMVPSFSANGSYANNQYAGNTTTVSEDYSGARLFTGDIYTNRDAYFDSSTTYQLPSTISSNDDISVIIKLDRSSVVDEYNKKSNYDGTVSDFSASDEGKAISRQIETENDAVRTLIEKAGVRYVDGNEYSLIMGGFDVTIKASDFATLSKAIDGKATAIIGDEYERCESQIVQNDVNVYDTGIFDSSQSEYQGDGVVVAVLDTGLDYTHTAFSVDNFGGAETARMTKSEVAKLVGNTRAYELSNGLTAEDVYMNIRIPFAYDYADKDSDVYPIESEHGTHVSGIIVGKDDTITGVAPNAQLVPMKVFSDTQTSAKQSWILSAVEDCVRLGVDVVNMSLGSSCGFTRESDKVEYNVIYDAVRDAGISLIAAASNDMNATFGSTKNGNLGLTTNPDFGTVGTPSTYNAALSVASISGVKTPYLSYNNKIMYFTEASDASAEQKHFVEELLAASGKESGEFEYITIPGIGISADYNGVDVTNKIVLVRRGTNTFEEKARTAQNNGALGIIIYNNVSGDISMNVGRVSIPVCSISQDNGEELAEARTGIIKISKDQVAGPFISSFSSWGPTGDLKIKPEITAHGGEILSAVPGQSYDRLSGTSMAAPNQAGVTALVRQYVKEKFPTLTPVEVTARVNQIMMSTTDIAYNTNGLPYAVRRQGAGLGNLQKATSSPAYLTTYDEDGKEMDKTKLELGDDPDKTGVYKMTFGINNISSGSLTYNVSAIVMTEGVSETKTHQGDTTVTEKGYQLNPSSVAIESVSGGQSSGNNVTVSANSTAVVTITIVLSDADKEYIDSSFANGMYVEGFVKVSATGTNTIDLSAPFLAFYGDWTQAPILDLDYFVTQKDEYDNSINAEDKTMPDAYATVPVGGLYQDYIHYLGSYYFVQDPSLSSKISADRKYISLSNQESAVNSIYGIWAGLLRNAKRGILTITDESTGEVIYRQEEYDLRKSRYASGSIRPTMMDVDFKVADYNLKNNTKYIVRFETFIDYGDGGAENNLNNVFEFPFVTDFEAPAITGSKFYTEYDKLEKKTKLYVDLSIYDNHYAMGAQIGTISKRESYGADESPYMLSTFGKYLTPIYSNFNSTATLTYELTDYIDQIKGSYNGKSIIIVVYDYAMNEAYYEIPVPNYTRALYFDNENISLSPNEVYTLSPNVYPADSWTEMLQYTSSDESIARIVGDKLIAVAPGEVTITAKTINGGYSAQATLNVKVLAEGEEGYIGYTPTEAESFKLTGYHVEKAFYFVNSSDREIGLTDQDVSTNGETFGLSMYPSESVTVKYELKSFFPDLTKVVFESNNSEIATIDENGTIIAQKEGIGSVTVSVLMNGQSTYYSQTISISVKNPYTQSGPMLTSYYGLGGVVEVPAELALDSIGQYAFSHYEYIPKDENDEISEEDPYTMKISHIGENTITKVILPEGIETIDAYAFAGLTALEEIVLPSTIVKINQGAFLGCTKLRKVVGIEKVKFINQYGFANCDLTGVNLEGIIAIGNYAFQNNKIVALDLPESAQSIGIGAFSYNKMLLNVSISAEKIKIGSEAFAYCEELKSIDINASVIPSRFMYGCKKLETATLGKDVAVIDLYAFNGTNLKKYIVSADNPLIKASSDGKMVLSKDGKTLVSFAVKGGSVTSSAEVDQITTIGKGAFAANQAIIVADLPNVTAIEDYAFYGCGELKTVILGDLERIGAYAFAETKLTATPNLSNVTEIGEYAFYKSSVSSVAIAPNTRVGDSAFRACAGLKTITIGNGAVLTCNTFRSDYDENFDCNSMITNVTIGNEVYIGDSAFYGAVNLEDVTIGNSVYVGDRAFFYNYSLKNIDLSSVTYIGDEAFGAMDLVKYDAEYNTTPEYRGAAFVSVDASSATYIGKRAFANCGNLASITISNEITEISDYAFVGCHSLTAFDFSNIEKLGEGAFANAGLSGADISSVDNIGFGAFYGNTNLTDVKLKKGAYIGGQAFYNDSALVNIANLGDAVVIGDMAFVSTAITKADITEVTELGNMAFANSSVTSVIFGNKLVSVGENPFAGCAIEAFESTTTESFGDDEFNTTITTFEISPSVHVYNGALYKSVPYGYVLVSYPAASTATNYTVEDGTVRISAYAFMGANISGVVLPRTLNAIGDKAFYLCANLSSVTFQSVNAPILEEAYDINYTLYTNLPLYGTYQSPAGEVECLGIVPYYMWNPSASIFYFGANFGDYIGHISQSIIMICPSNGVNYDSFVLNQYFTDKVYGKTAPYEATIDVISAINALPDYITLADENAVKAARALYDSISLVEQKALVANYEKLTSAEATLEYLHKQDSSDDESTSESVDEKGNSNGAVIALAILVGVFATATIALGVFLFLTISGKITFGVKKSNGEEQPTSDEEETQSNDEELEDANEDSQVEE